MPHRGRASPTSYARPIAEEMHASSVSVVIPCYNYGRYLRDCVRSVLEQPGVDVRVLIIDDASTDDSAAVAADLAADPRVELRVHALNQGSTRTFNEGLLQWATGTYTVLLDADDMLTPGALQRACALMDTHPQVGFVYGRPLIFHDRGALPHASRAAGRWIIQPGHRWFEARCRTAENCIQNPEVVMRSRWLRQLGGCRAELPHTSDFEMWMRLALYADVGYIRGPHQAYYRDHPASMRHVHFATSLADLQQVWSAFALLFRDHGHVLADRVHFEQQARRALARRALCAACRSYDWGPLSMTEVHGLEELATTVYDHAADLGESRGLRWRKRLGPRWCRILHPLFMVTVGKRLYRGLRRWRLRRTGR
ncbi:MAG: glycosyltransferase family 2 protein [Candidatus Binatia bacterium]